MKAILVFAVVMMIIIVIFDNLGTSEERGQEVVPQKYQRRFVYYNPNPTEERDPVSGEPKKWKKGDCVVRAFCGVLDLTWDEVYSDLCAIGAKYHDLPNSEQVWKHYAKQKGLVRMKRPNTNVSEFAATHDGVYFILLRQHAVCVKGNKVHDCWDSGWGRIRMCYEKSGTPSGSVNPVKRKPVRHKEPSDIEKEILKELEINVDPAFAEKDEGVYQYFNPNPEANVDEKTGKPAPWKSCDNVVRAFCGALKLPWDVVYADLCRIGKELYDLPDSREVIVRYAKEQGLTKKTLRSAMTLSSFAKSHDGVYLIQLKLGLNPEMTCIKDNKIYDIWRYHSRKFRTYYTKTE